MTDLVAVVAYIVDQEDRELSETIREITVQEHKRFSPLVTAYLDDEKLVSRIESILREDEPYYRIFFDALPPKES